MLQTQGGGFRYGDGPGAAFGTNSGTLKAGWYRNPPFSAIAYPCL